MGSADCGRELRQVRSRVQHTSDMEAPSRSHQPTCMHGDVLSLAARGVLTVRQRQPDLTLADVYAPEMSDELINTQPNLDRELDLLLRPGVAAARRP